MTDEITSATALPQEVAAIRTTVLGDRISITQAAAAFGVTERAIYLAIARHNIPFVKVFNTRYMGLADLRRTLLAQANAAPRSRGRPRKVA